MLAYFCLSGKQFVAKEGDIVVNCPFVKGNVGDVVITDQVLGIGEAIGSPDGKFLAGAKVELKIVKQFKSKKIRIVNFRPQKRHER